MGRASSSNASLTSGVSRGTKSGKRQFAGHRSRTWKSVNYLGFLSQQLGDLRGITTLTHKLIQNADDAKDDSGQLATTCITFDIRDDALVVGNDAASREVDFDRLRDVAKGGIEVSCRCVFLWADLG